MKNSDKPSKNIVVILGNGFDLDLGLKTSYKNFYESEFCQKNYPAPLIEHLNSWGQNINEIKWFDLENELLNYFLKIKEQNPYPDVVTSREQEYIKIGDYYKISFGIHNGYPDETQSLISKGILEIKDDQFYHTCNWKDDILQSSVWRDENAIKIIKQKLCEYLRSIYSSETGIGTIAYNVLRVAMEHNDNDDLVSVYSFNYTPLPEPLQNVMSDRIHYIHGNYQDGSVILGTKDCELNQDYDFLQKSFDPNYNPPAIVPDLEKATDVIIFGHSLGNSDSQYFTSFFQTQSSNGAQRKDITIFTYDDKSERELRRSINIMTGYNLSSFFSHNNVRFIKRSECQKDQTKYSEFIAKYVSKKRINEIIKPLKFEESQHK